MSVTRVLSQFRSLDQAIIDASSILYMKKAEYFDKVAVALQLYSPIDVIEETGHRNLEIRPLRSNARDLSPDKSLVQLAARLQWPVITEDLGIIKKLAKQRSQYFNSLMMLELLFSRGLVNQETYMRYLQKLLEQAWYSPEIVEFGRRVHRILEKQS
ncbi:MAG: hypothetical protein ACWGQW_17460 [bacterium]